MTADDETDRILASAAAEARRIEAELDANAASDALSAASVWRLLALAAFAAIAFIASDSAHEFAGAIKWLAIFGAISAGFHIVTWLALRAWHRRVHGRA